MPPFDPFHLTPEASLNRVFIVDLPGVNVDSGVLGKTAYDLVSTEALRRAIHKRADDLRIKKKLEPPELFWTFDACFGDERKSVRQAAETIATRIGRHLGYVLMTLKRGDKVNRKARNEWDSSYWDYWATIERVWLGGGLVSGALGRRLRDHALDVLAGNGISLALEISTYAPYLPLIGAACQVPADTSAALTFDFGSTLMKRACARYQGGQLASLRIFPPLTVGWETIEAAYPAPLQRASALFDRMIHLMTNTWHDAHAVGLRPAPYVALSISGYVGGSNPLVAQTGIYKELTRLSDNVQGALALRLGARVEESIIARLLHDGTAAAAVYAGSERTAVLTLGTAIGHGYPPPVGNLRPLAPDFAVLDETLAPNGEV